MRFRIDPRLEHSHCDTAGKAGMGETGFHLPAAVFAEERPLAQVFAVVGQEPIVVFAKPRAGTPDCFLGGEPWHGVQPDMNFMACGEAFERCFFDRTAMQRRRKTGVVNDPSIADIDTVVFVARALCHEVSTENGFAVDCDIGRCAADCGAAESSEKPGR
jgi:hypothetical protein